ncbi:peptide-methionine (R)-S-oxide reductase MsrB [Erythrobacter sp. EC-HK427]|uniref:peptide-methionine (R)-S-oxide reductase MsrB n=1 Tax=Erythrobacter sp. EC-HK427 TaxID=2038396 RepID=UPI001257D0D7|nr:peptide-methionine (R)-S-oxide reductase MsrB [Erythrobacter sp. EC-HK427]VVT02646.1 Methionine sulfoxide reductase B [Erythrobacter sp. EC-HK427]
MGKTEINRRKLLVWLGAGASLPVLGACGSEVRAQERFRVNYSEEEWRRRLTAEEFRILRRAGTERAFSSPLDREGRRGTFVCAGCSNRLYSSAHKFDSGTGWPSFWQPIESGAVGYSTDYHLGYARREIHCADCGGHLGHRFDDGPRPTGHRHCINGVAMDFRPA